MKLWMQKLFYRIIIGFEKCMVTDYKSATSGIVFDDFPQTYISTTALGENVNRLF